MKLLAATALLIVAVAGCSRERDAANAVVETAEPGDIVTVDSNDILFTTPTLNDAIPATEAGSKVGSDCIQLHEDDWRQFEFVDAGLKSEIDVEVADIGAIWDQNSVPLGESGTAFREVHVRKRIPNALNMSVVRRRCRRSGKDGVAIVVLTAESDEDPLAFILAGAPDAVAGRIGKYVEDLGCGAECEVDMGLRARVVLQEQLLTGSRPQARSDYCRSLRGELRRGPAGREPRLPRQLA